MNVWVLVFALYCVGVFAVLYDILESEIKQGWPLLRGKDVAGVPWIFCIISLFLGTIFWFIFVPVSTYLDWKERKYGTGEE